jgi:hypothetical protein
MKMLAPVFAIFLAVTISYGQSDVHGLDFKNFTYRPLCIGTTPKRVTVKDGEYSKETQMDGYVDRFSFNVMDVSYGDLNGDGKDEAIVLGVCNTGGTGNFSEGFIYTLRAGKPVLIARIPGGDRAYGGLRSATVSKGILSVESNDVGESGGACCPEFAITTQYKLTANKLAAFGRPTRRELYPGLRLVFDSGTSGTTIRLHIDTGDLKRYMVTARSGQVMFVSVNTDKASVRLLDDAQVTEGENGFSAKLPKNGDYTFEVQNITDKAIDVTVSVKIK